MKSRKSLVRIVVVFVQGQQVYLVGERFSSAGGELARMNEWLEKHSPHKVYPLFHLSSEPTRQEQASGLDRFFCIDMELGEGEARDRLRELHQLPFLEDAYVEEPSEPAGP